jgi:hypothetical protein
MVSIIITAVLQADPHLADEILYTSRRRLLREQ